MANLKSVELAILEHVDWFNTKTLHRSSVPREKTLFLHRLHPTVQQAYAHGTNYGAALHQAQREDHQAIDELVRNLESIVALRIYDIHGRQVRTLAEDVHLLAGKHAVSWNGRDERGQPLASGDYIAKPKLEDAEVVRKLVMMK